MYDDFVYYFFRVVYSLLLYINIRHGGLYSRLFNFFDGKVWDYFLLFLHWLPLNFLILKGEIITV